MRLLHRSDPVGEGRGGTAAGYAVVGFGPLCLPQVIHRGGEQILGARLRRTVRGDRKREIMEEGITDNQQEMGGARQYAHREGDNQGGN